ncbi:hypothetical protein FHR22_001360 [Sphingopyxis panaciterrae]|uniref:hypothetical protein n=1 Tax=Sphingopyxis panaciterrae TaxID=363841 RepID=UPI0014235DBD|nr:hypothetical protein [Sphingopyxis panaciterrae]NIJ36711.1 hypothetical protein [Sphingopyxis panaciterrae]
MNPSILYFSRWGNAIKALFFLGFAALSFFFSALLYGETKPEPMQEATVRPDLYLPIPAPRRDPLAPFKVPLLIAAGGVCLFYAGRHGARAISRRVAVRILDGHLHFHPSFIAAPRQLPIADIVEMIVDRADRLPGDGSRAAKLGARLRHGLYLRYRAGGGAIGEFRLADNDVDGGTGQLRRFAAHLGAWRQSAARAARRD